MAKVRFDQICAEFSKIFWHDSKLLDLHLTQHEETRRYDLRLDLDLIVGFSEGEIERRLQSAVFRDCRILKQTSTCWESYSAAVTLERQGVIQTRSSWKKGREIRSDSSIFHRQVIHWTNALASILK